MNTRPYHRGRSEYRKARADPGKSSANIGDQHRVFGVCSAPAILPLILDRTRIGINVSRRRDRS